MASKKIIFYYYTDLYGKIHYTKAIQKEKPSRNFFTDILLNTKTTRCNSCGHTRYKQYCYFCLEHDVIELTEEEIENLVKEKIIHLKEQEVDKNKLNKINKMIYILNH